MATTPNQPASDQSTGILRLYVPRAIGHFGNMFERDEHVFWELVGNAADAGATEVQIGLRPSEFTIVDNGSGMVPQVRPGDVATLQRLHQMVETGEEITDDVLGWFEPVSLRSLQWFMECGALSGKSRDPAPGVLGRKGVGGMGIRQIGGESHIVTLPNLELARAFWAGGNQPSPIPAYALTPPTNAQVDVNNRRYVTERVNPKELRDLRGHQLEHGTRVVIRDLREGVHNTIRAKALADSLGKTFAERIRKGLRIVIFTEAARGEVVEIPVQPARIVGIPIFSGTLYLNEKTKYGPFPADIYYVPEPSSRNRIMLLFEDTEAQPITNFPQFNHELWTSGNYPGAIGYPTIPEAKWTTGKKTPVNNQIFAKWVKVVWELAPLLQKAAEEAEARRKNARVKNLQEHLTTAVNKVIMEHPLLSDTRFKGATGTGGSRKGKSNRPKKLDRLLVTVKNEHGSGIPNVMGELVSEGSPPKEFHTRSRGSVSLGKLDPGKYTVKIKPPKGTEPRTRTSHVVEIDAHNPGEDVVFHLFTNEPAPIRRPPAPARLQPSFFPWADPDQPYSIERMPSGILAINTEGHEMRSAINDGNAERQCELAAYYVAAGLIQFRYPGETTTSILYRIGSVFADLFEATMESLDSEQRKRQRARK